jgi:protein required for attachment to host cells
MNTKKPAKKKVAARRTGKLANLPLRPAAKRTWIVVGHRGGAKIYEHAGIGRGIKMIDGMTNPTGRSQNRELVSDRPGRAFASRGAGGRHTLTAKADAHEQALTVFVRDLAQYLRSGLSQKRFERLVLVAEPHFLGKLRKVLPRNVASCVQGAVRKDLFRSDRAELVRHLEKVVAV